MQTAVGISNPRPNIGHLRIYGCRAYALNHRIPRTRKLEPRTHIGNLAGYDSTNIFRIWIPSKRKVISTRDVTFNESLFYDPKSPDIGVQFREQLDQILEVIEMPEIPQLSFEEVLSDSDEEEESNVGRNRNGQQEGGTSECVRAHEEVHVESSAEHSDAVTPALPTPDATPEPNSTPVTSLTTPPHATQQPSSQVIEPAIFPRVPQTPYPLSSTSRRESNREIIGDVTEGNIIEGKRD